MNYRELLVQDLQNLYQAESEQEGQLRRLADLAQNAQLKSALQDHAVLTERQAARLREVLSTLRETPGGKGETPYGLKALTEEFERQGRQIREPALRDLELIAAVQRIQHYEIAYYGSLQAMARTAGLDQAAHLLQTSLDEERALDRSLTEIALPLHRQAAQSASAIPM